VVLSAIALGMLAIAAVLAWWTWGYFNLRYSLDPDALVIRWAASRYVLPYASIAGHGPVDDAPAGRRRGLSWPGYVVGRRADGPGVRLSLATRPASEQLLIRAEGAELAISPAQPELFVQDLQNRRRLAGATGQAPRMERGGLAALSLWDDPMALRALAVGLMLNLLASGWIAWQYPGLPEQVALRYRYDPEVGLTLRGLLQPLATVWRLPLLSLAVLVLDLMMAALIHSRIRLGANLLLLGGAIVQAGLVLMLTRLG
jgi:hypothetical protein